MIPATVSASGACQVSAISTNSMFVSWNGLLQNASTGIHVRYNISSYSKTSTSENKLSSIYVDSTNTNYTLQGLTSNTVYVIIISVVNASERGLHCTIEATTLSQATSSRKTGVLTKSEMALVIISGSTMFIVLFLILLSVCIEKHNSARRRKKHMGYYKSWLGERNKIPSISVKASQCDPAEQETSTGPFKQGRILPQLPPVIRVEQTTDISPADTFAYDEETQTTVEDTPRTMRRKMGLASNPDLNELERV
eukprot:gene7870-8720_t